MSDEFHIGDFVKVKCFDGAAFFGDLIAFTDDYVVVGGRGFPIEDVVLSHA